MQTCRGKASVTALCAVGVVFLVCGCHPSSTRTGADAGSSPPSCSWTNPSPQGNGLNAVWSNSVGDAWAVGGSGTISRWSGGAWTPVESGITAELWAVWGASPNDVWMVGDGPILHWDGTAVRQVPGPAEDNPGINAALVLHSGLSTIWGSGPRDVWAAGYFIQTSVLHWDGSSWTHIPTGSVHTPWGLWGSGPDDVWLAADDSSLHWDGRGWTVIPLPVGTSLVALWGSGPNDVWGVGGSTLLHWDGSAWNSFPTAVDGYLFDVWGSGPDDVWALGQLTDGSGAFFHWDGATWAKVASPPEVNLVNGMSGSGSADVWAVGSAGSVLHWGGSGWKTTSATVTNSSINGLWGSGPADIWGVGAKSFQPSVQVPSDSALVHWDGKAWSPVSDPSVSGLSLGAVWGSGADDVWAVGDQQVVVRWNGTSWSSIGPPNGVGVSLRGIWGTGPTDVWVVGSQGARFHWDGSSWTPVPTPGRTFNGIWASGPSDAWAVGEDTQYPPFPSRGPATYFGVIEHWDGKAWTTVVQGLTDHPIDAVWGTGPGDAWAVGHYGVVLHWDGTRWASSSAGTTATLVGVSGSGPEDVWAVGGSQVLHWDGSSWTTAASPIVESGLSSTWSPRPGEAWALGGGGTILHCALEP